MRRLVLLKFCQICWKEDRREVAAEFSETINGKDLDLCESHGANIPIRLLIPTLDEYGMKAQPAARTPQPKELPPPKPEKSKIKATSPRGKYRCEVPGCNWGPNGRPHESKSPQGRGAHMRTRHGIKGTSKINAAEKAAAAK